MADLERDETEKPLAAIALDTDINRYTLCGMGERVRPLYSFAIDPDLAAGLKVLKQRHGVPESETIRRALRQWLEREGAIPKREVAIPKGGPKPATAGRKGATWPNRSSRKRNANG